MPMLVVSCRHKRAPLVVPPTYAAVFVTLAPPPVAIVLERCQKQTGELLRAGTMLHKFRASPRFGGATRPLLLAHHA